MAVLNRAALEDSPLADLHLIASELGIDGFRRLRKADLVDEILRVQGDGDEPAGAPAEEDEDEERPRARRRSRRRRRSADEDEPAEAGEDEPAEEEPRAEEGDAEQRPRGRRRRGAERAADEAEERQVEGVVELLPNGSGFVRVDAPEASDDDVYISAAQVRRCELVAGDRVSGPVRPPRRSERHPSLVRVETINGRSADEVAEGTPFDELPCTFPTERFAPAADDPVVAGVDELAPIGRGSRVSIVGPSRAGKTEVLRRLAAGLAGQEGVEVSVVLAGARPEETQLWRDVGIEPAAATGLGASADAQSQAVERAIDTAKRVAARGGDAVVCIDHVDLLHPAAARKALGAARNIVDGGSLTVLAVGRAPVGGETTVVALDAALAATGRFPAIDVLASGTLRAELLVGEDGAAAITALRAAAVAA